MGPSYSLSKGYIWTELAIRNTVLFQISAVVSIICSLEGEKVFKMFFLWKIYIYWIQFFFQWGSDYFLCAYLSTAGTTLAMSKRPSTSPFRVLVDWLNQTKEVQNPQGITLEYKHLPKPNTLSLLLWLLRW